jgi:serine/threonine-protein kinase
VVIGVKYRLMRKIGEGSMGEVWEAEHVALGHHLAVKLMRDVTLQSPDACKRFELEARTGAHLAQMTEHVTRIFDYGFDPRGPFIAMELLEGESLASYIDARGHLTPRRAAAILAPLARSLRKAHAAGVVHRDLKFENVYLARRPGEDERLKILDFGICKLLPPGGAPMRTLLAGTPSFMSPELVDGQPIDTRADLWAITVMLYRMLTGRMPFVGEDCASVMHAVRASEAVPPSHLIPRLGTAIDAFFARGLACDISLRFQTITELETAFVAASRRQPSSTQPPGAASGGPRYTSQDSAPASCAARASASPAACTSAALMPTLPLGCGLVKGNRR